MLIGAFVVVLVALGIVIAVQLSTASDVPVDPAADRRSFCASMRLVDPVAAVGLRGADVDPDGTRLIFSDAFVRGAPDDVRARAQSVTDAMLSMPQDGFSTEVRDRVLDDLLVLGERADSICEEPAPEP